MRRVLLLTMMLPLAAAGDAGYLGNVAQGPVPFADPAGTSVRMLQEDVLVELDETRFSVVAGFLFYSPVDEDGVYMYFPVDVLTPFVSGVYSALEPAGLLEHVSVSVNGVEAEVFPLFIGPWCPGDFEGATWEDMARVIRPLDPGEPAAGGPVFFTRMPSAGELGSFGFEASMDPPLPVSSLNAAWVVGFEAGDTVLVECCIDGVMTQDYDETFGIFSYPLQTGRAWAGDIGKGSILVVPSEGAGIDDIVFAVGVRMPEPTREEPCVYTPMEGLARHPGFDGGALSSRAGASYEGGIRWTFEDFEPEIAATGWRSLYPGLGDMYAMVTDSLVELRHGFTDVKPVGWSSSFLYVYVADEHPEYLTVISVDGVPLHRHPSEDSDVEARLPFGTTLEVVGWGDPWILVDALVTGILAGDEAGEYRGWVDLSPVDSEGLTMPAAMPLL